MPPGRFPEHRRDNLSRTMQEAAEPTGVPTLNLFVPFRGAHPETLYFRGGDTHWNSAGQALAAQLVARFIEARGLLR